LTDFRVTAPPPPKAPPVNYAATVAAFGQALFGRNWAAGVGRLADVNPRTLTRIHAAAREGRDYAAARGVLAALHEKLAPIVAELKPWARHATDE
jgi:hypothetical protein